MAGLLKRLFGRDRQTELVFETRAARPMAPLPEDLFDWSMGAPTDHASARGATGAHRPPPPPPPPPAVRAQEPLAPISAALADFYVSQPPPYGASAALRVDPATEGPQVRLMLADGTIAEAGWNPALARRIAYLASNLFPPSPPGESVPAAVSSGGKTFTPRVRFYLTDGTVAEATADPELAERIAYLAANLFPASH